MEEPLTFEVTRGAAAWEVDAVDAVGAVGWLALGVFYLPDRAILAPGLPLGPQLEAMGRRFGLLPLRSAGTAC